MSVSPQKIKKLEGQVIDQIAAGEVIERPSQLIKELIENSLDANAKSVELSVSSGLATISVTDDGHGVQKKDLPLVFERHSTSKIEKANDLFNLKSFGFRGEALAAIGSISHVQFESKSEEEKNGNLMIWEGGYQKGIEESDISQGTKISISKLFDNAPVRKKFLKSQRYELTLVKRVFNSFALKHFDKDFKLLVDGKLQSYYTKTSSLLERYKAVYNVKAYQINITPSEFILDGSHIILEEPGIDSKTSNSLWIYVQNRWVEDKAIHAAVRDGLNTYLMHGCHPKGLVNLKLDPQFVDVNVHPMKSQMRYQDSSHLYKAIRSAISNWAALAPWQASEVKTEKFESVEDRPQTNFYYQKPKINHDLVNESIKAQMPFELSDQKVQYKKTYGDLKAKNIEKVIKEDDQFEPLWSKLMVIGQVNLTYLVCQSEDSVYFIDQHAAHERVGYEKLVRAWKKEGSRKEIQSLLLPLNIDLEEEEVEVLLKLKESLLEVGISIEQGGPTYVVLSAHPLFLKEEAVEKALRDLSRKYIKYGGGASVDEIFELFFATVSCHSVIRAGHAMAEEEIKLLLLEMDKYRSHFCPHGRPVYKKISFSSLDKDFGRSI